MALTVFDYRTDVRNIVVTPEIRGRFLRMEPSDVATRHSHDLGHEIFLVLEGQCEFEIAGERAVLGPGQACFARRDELHQVRVVGDQPMTMYLSVTPHVEPTHTFWTADPSDGGEKLPPRYGGWRSAERDQIPDTTTPAGELIDRQLTAMRSLAEQSLASLDRHVQIGAALKQALADDDLTTTKALTDAFWQEIYPILKAAGDLAEAWNALAPVAAPPSRD